MAMLVVTAASCRRVSIINRRLRSCRFERRMARACVIPAGWAALGLVSALLSAMFASSAHAAIKVSPAAIKLNRPEASQQLLITEFIGDKQRDATRDAKFEVKPPAVVSVHADGLMEPLEEGATTVI